MNGFDTANARATFWKVFALTLALKVGLAAWLPFSGDEAFFYQWGVHPAWGYSDHPPMVGWLLWVLRHLGDSPLALRSVTLLVTSVLALGLVDLARRILPPGREAAAWLAGAIYLALPFSWLFVLVTTDTPLILFMGLSVWCFVRAELAARPAGWYAAAGALLGLAFLSKYFAVLLGLGYLLWIVGWRRERWWALLLGLACAAPSVALHLWFNAHHGWTNIMFNVLNRNEDTQWSLADFAVYAAMMAYLLTPWLLWQGARARGDARPASRLLALLWIAPFALFALVAMRRSVGLHWVLGFVPVFVLWAGLRIAPEGLARSLRWTGWLALPHALGLAVLLATPLAWWQSTKVFPSLVFLREAPAITAALTRELPAGATLMARAYSPASVLAYHAGHYVPVFGPGRFHARQDDLLVDFRAYEGRSIRIYDRRPMAPADFAPWFDRVHPGSFTVAGLTLHYLDGEGFRFQPYRDTVLQQVVDRYHQVPPMLTILGSPFCERYGFASCAPGRGANLSSGR